MWQGDEVTFKEAETWQSATCGHRDGLSWWMWLPTKMSRLHALKGRLSRNTLFSFFVLFYMPTECLLTSLSWASAVSQMCVQTWYQSQDTFYRMDFWAYKTSRKDNRDMGFWCAQAERRITIKHPSVSPRLLCGSLLLPAICLMQICCFASPLRSYCVYFLLVYYTQSLDMTQDSKCS